MPVQPLEVWLLRQNNNPLEFGMSQTRVTQEMPVSWIPILCNLKQVHTLKVPDPRWPWDNFASLSLSLSLLVCFEGKQAEARGICMRHWSGNNMPKRRQRHMFRLSHCSTASCSSRQASTMETTLSLIPLPPPTMRLDLQYCITIETGQMDLLGPRTNSSDKDRSNEVRRKGQASSGLCTQQFQGKVQQEQDGGWTRMGTKSTR